MIFLKWFFGLLIGCGIIYLWRFCILYWLCDFYYSSRILQVLPGVYSSWRRVLINISRNADSDKNSFVYVRTSNSNGIREDLVTILKIWIHSNLFWTVIYKYRMKYSLQNVTLARKKKNQKSAFFTIFVQIIPTILRMQLKKCRITI